MLFLILKMSNTEGSSQCTTWLHFLLDWLLAKVEWNTAEVQSVFSVARMGSHDPRQPSETVRKKIACLPKCDREFFNHFVRLVSTSKVLPGGCLPGGCMKQIQRIQNHYVLSQTPKICHTPTPSTTPTIASKSVFLTPSCTLELAVPIPCFLQISTHSLTFEEHFSSISWFTS